MSADTFRVEIERIIDAHDADDGMSVSRWTANLAAAIARARALLAQPEPEGEGLTEIALRMLGTIESMELIIPEITDTIRKALEQGRPTPQPPADGEVAEVIAVLREIHDCFDIASGMEGCGPFVARAADLLQRFASPAYLVVTPSPEAAAAFGAAHIAPGRFELLPDDAQIIEPSERTVLVPALKPVPVSERLPGAEDCDDEGCCWMSTTATDPGWVLDYPEHCTNWTHWLPANALPTP